MTWEKLQAEASKIVANKPTGDFKDVTFSIGSGQFHIMEGLPVLHYAEGESYSTVRHGSTCAKDVTIRCRDTGAIDSDGRTIYESENGIVFVFSFIRSNAYRYAEGYLEVPAMQATTTV